MSDAPQPIFTLSESLPWYRKTSTKWIAIAALVVLLLLMWRCGKSASVNVRSAKQAVEHFHQQFNEGKFEDIYNEATDQFRNATTKDQCLEFFSAVRRKLGNVVRTNDPQFFINASTNGTFVTLTYKTDFTHGSAQERFIWTLTGGKATLIRYNIDSRDLIVK